MGDRRTVLIVDDESHIRAVVRYALERAGFEVAEAGSGKEAIALHAQLAPALVVLDIVMPGMDGLEVCRELRSQSPTPVVFLSSRDEELDRVVGLEIGGDDYVTKPFSPRELVARVRAVLRRSLPTESTTTEEPVHQVGALILDSARFEVTVSGQTLPLTLTEFNLLKTFMVRPGIVFTRQQILDRVYGLDVVVSDRTIDSHVRRLRRKFAALGADPIETVHGLGYRLREAGE